MTDTKAALHAAVDQLDDSEAEAMLATIRARRLTVFLADVEEVDPDEFDRDMIAGIAPAEVRETISATDLERELGTL